MTKEEKVRVESCAQNGTYALGVMKYATDYCGKIFERFMINGSVLEMGPAEGVMTSLLYPKFNDYTVVDGADFFIDSLRKKFPEIKAHACLFEAFEPIQKFDNIILGHVLEHVENPCSLLKKSADWLNESGRILVAVPNANSIHRQAAVKMGLLKKEDELNDTDRLNGHRRVYNLDTLEQNFIEAGLSIVKSGGYWLKPVSNAQIDETWTEKMIFAFLELGEKYPEISGEIYVVAEKLK